MVHLIADRLAVFLFKNRNHVLINAYIYGLETMLASLIETTILIIIGALLGETVGTLFFIVCFSLLRIFTGGYHAPTFLKCIFVTVTIFLITLLIYKNLYFCSSKCMWVIAQINCFALLFIVFLFGPIENKHKKIENKIKNKIMASAVAIIENCLFITLYFLLNFKTILIVLPTQFFVSLMMIYELIRKAGEKYEIFD
jgi:accessory gene regulator B